MADDESLSTQHITKHKQKHESPKVHKHMQKNRQFPFWEEEEVLLVLIVLVVLLVVALLVVTVLVLIVLVLVAVLVVVLALLVLIGLV